MSTGELDGRPWRMRREAVLPGLAVLACLGCVGASDGLGGLGGESGSGARQGGGGASATSGTPGSGAVPSGGGQQGSGGLAVGDGDGTGGEATLPDPDSCVAAVDHAAGCCPAAVALRAADIALDPCVVAQGEPPPGADVYLRCREAFGDSCAAVRCAPDPFSLASRVARAHGTLGCVLGDECTLDEDCVVVFDTAKCCTCAEVVPVALLPQRACYQRADVAGAAPCQCDEMALCGACPEPPAAAHCRVQDLYNRCAAPGG